MKQRIITAAVMIGVLAPFFVLGGHWTDVPVMWCVASSGYEMSRLFKDKWPVHMAWTSALWITLIGLCVLYAPAYQLAVFGLFIVYMTMMVLVYEQVKIEDVCVVMMVGFLFIMAVMGYRSLSALGRYAFSALIIGTSGADIGAYFFGRSFGKHKLLERISPKKTTEGFWGGVFTGFILGAVFLYLWAPRLPLGLMLALAFFIPLAGAIGDLFFSAIKRHYGIKDYGTYLPGHGGTLDRIDSILFSMMFAYIVLIVL